MTLSETQPVRPLDRGVGPLLECTCKCKPSPATGSEGFQAPCHFSVKHPFEKSAVTKWSQALDFPPTVPPNGLMTTYPLPRFPRTAARSWPVGVEGYPPAAVAEARDMARTLSQSPATDCIE